MAQVKLTLQPPPNVDFVTGYPGIPPGPERPQAAVKGAVEVRIPSQGVKAKWVRIELRKVETLPGGGTANTFHDSVEPSPVNLWTSPDEYTVLRSQDFPFSIRIPESIPPTVSLDNRAGIGYELVASICTKGKRVFLRKAKSVVVTAVASIIIDKHELHSAWPIYCQPETRHIAQDGVSLSVQRNNTCYGPGDTITVTAVVKSDSLHTVILRMLELSLKETTVFRAGILAPGKRSVPQERQLNIAEIKLAVNATLYGGTSHSANLSCVLSPAHTTTSLNAARHIDITYTLCIRALLGTGGPISMELPIMISNWQRNVSYEAISRIGAAPGLSLFPAAQGSPSVPPATSTRIDPTRGRPADAVAATLPVNRANIPNRATNAYNSLPTSSNTRLPVEDRNGATRLGSNGVVDDFGATRKPSTAVTATVTSPPIAPPAALSTNSSNSTTARRPNSSGGNSRFTVTNQQPQDLPKPQSTPARQRSANATGSGTSPGNAQRAWPTAEEEKLRLYEKAKAQAAKVQGLGATPPPADVRASPPPQTTTITPSRVVPAAVPSPTKAAWLTAEEEKLRLFQQAQAAVQRNQGLPYTAPPPAHARNNSDHSMKVPASSGGSGTKSPSAAATLYTQAVNAQSRLSPGPSVATPSRTNAVVPQYLTADEEKAALRRYEEAKRAVDRTQNSGFDEPPPDHTAASSAPIAYESLFPAAASTSRPGATDEPPPFTSSPIPQSHLSEKERLRRAYEASDAAARARQNDVNNSTPPPPISPPTQGQYANALEEKEALRRKFEARDNAQAKIAAIPQTPPRAGTVANSPANETSPSTGSRPTPLPPATAASRVLSAAEEKALLRAKFEARDAQANRVNGSNVSLPIMTSTPPPLMPRPPVEYIKETQEEDARVSRLNGEPPVIDLTPDNSRRGTPKISQAGSPSGTVSDANGGNGQAALDMKPFSPFGAAFERSPPLPTKLPGE